MSLEIITFYWSNNPGALIQSISLREFLKSQFKKRVLFNRFMPGDLILAERKSQLNKSNFRLLINILNQKRNLFNWKKKIANFQSPIKKKFFLQKVYIFMAAMKFGIFQVEYLTLNLIFTVTEIQILKLRMVVA